jgi:hypothetical protein
MCKLRNRKPLKTIRQRLITRENNMYVMERFLPCYNKQRLTMFLMEMKIDSCLPLGIEDHHHKGIQVR